MVEWFQLIFGMEAFLGICNTVFKGNLGICKNNGTSLWDFSHNSELRKILPQHVHCCQVPSMYCEKKTMIG